jgi:hypothetical protein
MSAPTAPLGAQVNHAVNFCGWLELAPMTLVSDLRASLVAA